MLPILQGLLPHVNQVQKLVVLNYLIHLLHCELLEGVPFEHALTGLAAPAFDLFLQLVMRLARFLTLD